MPVRTVTMQVARSKAGRALAEVTFDALAADLTVPHSRPLVDLDRDDYADVEIDDEPGTVRYQRVELPTEEPTTRVAKRTPWRGWAVALAVAMPAIGFALGAGVSLLIK